MKFFLILFFNFIYAITLSANTLQVETKIYKMILADLFPDKHTIAVWADDAEHKHILEATKMVKLVEDPKEAELLFVSHNADMQIHKPKFVSSYRLLKHYKQDAIGGFYWQKGRPNLIFLDKNLKKYGLGVSSKLLPYIDDSL